MTPLATRPAAAEQLWERMAGLRLRLGDTVEVAAHRYRGRPWYLVRNTFGGQQYRLSERVYRVIAELDGRRTLAQVWQRLIGAVTADPGGRQELLGALTQLLAVGMLSAEGLRDVRPLIAQQQLQRRRRRWSRWLRLLSPRLPLLDPDRLLARGLPWVGWLFHPAVLAAGFALILYTGLQALMHWEALALYGLQRLDDPRSWLLLVCLYPLVKALHELGHGFAAKAGGAEIHEMGVTLLVFLPVPYVDASAASAFPSKYRRMLVGAAGILVEALLAALALVAWLQLPDGLLRDAAFAVMLIGGVSTVLFNGNPLLRFDGYYVLADAVEIPNLATRAARYYGYLARRYLLGLRAERAPLTAAGERAWFLGYGAASTVYRLAVAIGIALFLIAVVPTLGVLLAGWLLLVQVVLPLGRQVRYLLFNPALAGRRLRALMIVGSLIAGAVALLVLLPLPNSTRVEGVVLLPEEAIVRVGEEGFFEQQLAAHGARVKEGDPLFRLSNHELEAETAVLRARVQELAARRDAVGLDDRVAREIHAERLAEARAELAELERRVAGLEIRSPADGVLRIPQGQGRDLPGRLVRQGELLAYIADQTGARVRIAAPQDDAACIREAVEGVQVRLADSAAPLLPGELLGEVPAASDELPSAALGSRGGGAIAVDARDVQGRKALHKVFAFDVTVPHVAATQFVGSRAYVRFEHPPVPLLTRWYDAARRLVLKRVGE